MVRGGGNTQGCRRVTGCQKVGNGGDREAGMAMESRAKRIERHGDREGICD